MLNVSLVPSIVLAVSCLIGSSNPHMYVALKLYCTPESEFLDRVDVMRSRGPVTIIRDPMRPRFGGARKEVEREKSLPEKEERKVLEDERKVVDEKNVPEEAPAAEEVVRPGSPDSNTDAASSVTASDNESLDGEKGANIVKDEEEDIHTSDVAVESKVESSVVKEDDDKGDVVDGKDELKSVAEVTFVESKLDGVDDDNVVEKTIESKSEMKTESASQDGKENQTKPVGGLDTTDATDAEETISDKLADTKEPEEGTGEGDATEIKTVKTDVKEIETESMQEMDIKKEITSDESKIENTEQTKTGPVSEQLEPKGTEIKSQEVSGLSIMSPKETDEQPVARETNKTAMKDGLVEHEVFTSEEKLTEQVEKKPETEITEKAEAKAEEEVDEPQDKLDEPTDRKSETEHTEALVEDKQAETKQISAHKTPEKEAKIITENVGGSKLETVEVAVAKSESESVDREPTKELQHTEIKIDESKSQSTEKGAEETNLVSVEEQIVETKSECVEKETEIETKSTEKAETHVETKSKKTESEYTGTEIEEANIKSEEKTQETQSKSTEEKEALAQKSDEKEAKTEAEFVSSAVETDTETVEIKPGGAETKSKDPEIASEYVEQESIKPVSETIEKIEAISSQSEEVGSTLPRDSKEIEKANNGVEMEDNKKMDESKPIVSESEVVSAEDEKPKPPEEVTSAASTEHEPKTEVSEPEILTEKIETVEATKTPNVEMKEETHDEKRPGVPEQDESVSAGKPDEKPVTTSEMISDMKTELDHDVVKIQKDIENIIDSSSTAIVKSEINDTETGKEEKDTKSVPTTTKDINVDKTTKDEGESKAKELQDDAVKSSDDAICVGEGETKAQESDVNEIKEDKEVDKIDISKKELLASEVVETNAKEAGDKTEKTVADHDNKADLSEETLQNGIPDDGKTNVKIEEKKEILLAENGLPDEGKDDSQVSMKMMRGEVSAKTTYQRTSTGPVAICEVSPEGKFICLENTSSGPNRKEVSLDGWKIRRIVDGKRDYVYPFRNFTLKSGKKVKILARGSGSEAGLNDLVFRDEDNWGVGSQVTTSLVNDKDEEKATHVQKTLYN